MAIFTVCIPGGPVAQVGDGESLLDAFLRQGIALPFSCRGGTCHTCVQRCIAGTPPPRAQRGLSAERQALGYFLPCVCHPAGDMVITPPDPAHFAIGCLVEAVVPVTDGVTLRLEPLGELAWSIGQIVVLRGPDGTRLRAEVRGLPQDNFYADVHLVGPCPAGWQPGQELQLHIDNAGPQLPAVGEGTGTIRPDPDPALWRDLDDGRTVRAVLDTFYREVFADPVLAPYFQGTNADHVAGKQFSFLCKSMTGEDVYFGDNPRDAHHWMVIPPSVFDHRQAVMAWSQRRHGLTEDQMRRWSAFELPYRADLVKDRPVPVRRFGVELPLDGMESTMMDVDFLCDGCGGEVAAGQLVQMHRRLGTIYCAACSGAGASHPASAGQQ